MKRVAIGLLVGLEAACFVPPSYSTAGGGGGAAYQPPPRPAYHDPSFDHSPGELDGFIVENTRGFTKEGPAASGRLEAFEPLPVTLRRGRCYRMVLRLDEGAAFSELARRGVAFIYRNGDRGMEVNGGPGLHGPTGGVASGGCPQQTAHATFDMIANWGSAVDKSHIHELGTGGFTLQLYSKAVSDKELAARKADEDEQIAESDRFRAEEQRKQRERVTRGCQVCQQKRLDCIADWRRGASRETCEREYDSCVFSEAGLASGRDCR
ncbi:MAG TPA: hypothetical protein VLM85_21655 [Polyangiaceae bacterium]|nr:hypothetical protein [Polyangiaceae bacterium]